MRIGAIGEMAGASLVAGPQLQPLGKEMHTSPGSGDLFAAISAMHERLMAKGGNIPEFLRLQSYLNVFNVRVELLSKVAEGANSALRRLQNNQ